MVVASVLGIGAHTARLTIGVIPKANSDMSAYPHFRLFSIYE
jgi:hypothetical protein